MSKVIADITMSLDGYVTGPDPDLEHGLGRGGEPLHSWVESDHEIDKEVLREIAAAPGAVVMGRRLFDVVDGPHGWSDEMGYGAEHATTPRFFVVTHSAPQHDELHLHLAPMLLGGGTPLFRAGTRQRYRQRDVRPLSNAVHLTYERLIGAEQ
jgi:dihydrofolate reductase